MLALPGGVAGGGLPCAQAPCPSTVRMVQGTVCVCVCVFPKTIPYAHPRVRLSTSGPSLQNSSMPERRPDTQEGPSAQAISLFCAQGPSLREAVSCPWSWSRN